MLLHWKIFARIRCSNNNISSPAILLNSLFAQIRRFMERVCLACIWGVFCNSQLKDGRRQNQWNVSICSNSHISEGINMDKWNHFLCNFLWKALCRIFRIFVIPINYNWLLLSWQSVPSTSFVPDFPWKRRSYKHYENDDDDNGELLFAKLVMNICRNHKNTFYKSPIILGI